MNNHNPPAAQCAPRVGPDGEDPRPANPSGGNFSTTLLVGLIILATFAAYSRTLNFHFVFDDRPWLVENPALHSWRYLSDYFTKQVWAGVYPSDAGNYYRPVFLLWMRLNVWLFGPAPAGYHFVAVLLHLLVTLLVFKFSRRISGDRNLALAAAAIFGLHPVHIESVAWILGSTDTLAAVFLLSSFLCWEKSLDPVAHRHRWLFASWALFGIALLAKETALLFPVLLIVHVWTAQEGAAGRPGRLKTLSECFRSVAPFLAIMGPYLVVRWTVLHGFSHPSTSITWGSIFMTWPSLICFWAKHLVWPVGLSSFYEFPAVTQPTLINFTLPLSAALVIGLLLAWGSLRSNVMRIGAAWLIIPGIPSFDLRVFWQNDFAHDRFLYLSSAGFALIVACLLQNISFAGARRFAPRLRFGALLAVLAGLLTAGTALQNSYFRDDAHFYRHNYRAAPDNPYAASDLAAYLGEHEMYAESAKILESLIRTHPDDWGALYNLGHTYYKTGRLTEAITLLERAVALDPSKPEPFLDLGSAWLRLQQYNNAENAFRRAIVLRPDGKGYHFALGIVLEASGRCQDALKEFQLELTKFPEEEIVKRQIAASNCRLVKSGS